MSVDARFAMGPKDCAAMLTAIEPGRGQCKLAGIAKAFIHPRCPLTAVRA